jgi:hypothetical protein
MAHKKMSKTAHLLMPTILPSCSFLSTDPVNGVNSILVVLLEQMATLKDIPNEGPQQ